MPKIRFELAHPYLRDLSLIEHYLKVLNGDIVDKKDSNTLFIQKYVIRLLCQLII